jgi:hypothetical protein
MADWVTGVLLLLQRQRPYTKQRCLNLVPGQVVVGASNHWCKLARSTAKGYQPDKETRLCHVSHAEASKPGTQTCEVNRMRENGQTKVTNDASISRSKAQEATRVYAGYTRYSHKW